MTGTETHATRIKARIAELQARLQEIEKTLDEPLDRDPEEQAIDLEDDEVLEAVGYAGLQEIRLLEGALARIADGTYGICQTCGEPIAEVRLKAVPYTGVCRTCARGRT
ncbi:MAG: TraR/DksA family transcriptional regulator [Alphaproteobacteria bacterium]|nr:TraR/DksA family transcriptional regulator [Alphaproteobacteria bacterium]NNF25011.1 TraR/DksA family transcriptional regulator [Paracoccaceae bacterium]